MYLDITKFLNNQDGDGSATPEEGSCRKCVYDKTCTQRGTIREEIIMFVYINFCIRDEVCTLN